MEAVNTGRRIGAKPCRNFKELCKNSRRNGPLFVNIIKKTLLTKGTFENVKYTFCTKKDFVGEDRIFIKNL